MERRSFLKWAINGLGALWAAVLGIPSIAYLFDARNRPAAAGKFKPVAKLSELEINVPKQVVIRDTRRDAWTLYSEDVIGRVWLVRRDKNNVDAFTTICPHLGCSVNYENKSQRFVCPCHNATFHLSGDRLGEEELGTKNPAPRGMDSLELSKEPVGDDFLIRVKYENFRQGSAQREAKA